eukprot:403370170
MAIGGAGNYFTTESENNPYEESDSSVDRTHRRNISLKGDPQYGQSSSNRSRKSSHRVQHSSQQPKSGGLKHSQSTETLKSDKIGEYGNNGQLSDFATMSQHQNKKNTDSLVRSSIIPENNVQNSSKANQNYLSPQQSIVFSGRKSKLNVQQSMESIQEYQTAASNMSIKELKEMRRKSKKIMSEQQKEKAILHKHTIKVLRPATAQQQSKQYQSTNFLSKDLQPDQLVYAPKQVYFKYTKKPKFIPNNPVPAIYDSGCLTCGQKNVEVEFHGERHVCYKCKKYLQTPDGKPVMLISTPDSRILAFFKKIKTAEELEKDKQRRYSYIEVDPNDMRIFDKVCFATFAGEGELIVLLKDEGKKQIQNIDND